MTATIIILLILAVLLVIFTLQNTTLITLKIFFWELADVPLVLALIVCLLAGFILAYLVQYSKIMKLRKELKTTRNKLDELEEEFGKNPVPSDDVEIDGEHEGFFNE